MHTIMLHDTSLFCVPCYFYIYYTFHYFSIMFCVECGGRLIDGGKFCHACGTSLKKICDTSDSELPTINIKPKGSNVQSNSVVNRERIKSNLATLKVKFLESRSKMDARRLKKGRNEPLPSTGLGTLEVRFIDRAEKRMQLMLPEGSSFLNIEVESVSTSEDWMRMVTALFTPCLQFF
ncbi:uncharacterized protein LOC125660273 isoform X2 [Ostrea edulis]|uniref:uncharacterized protein LOC125660273 isoform X2 n=1 Tax=Ostrea edulis TaxID=37623 RepID=UPI0024AEBFFC|nr:uncharacterized protein LOC125660273 isoform X2 [Ostrea edulis]